MTGPHPDRWRDVSRIYHLARQLDGAARDRLLRDECRDESLRSEVESLLAQPDGAWALSGAGPGVALRGGAPDAGMTGRRIGSYQLGPSIGAGGMGEVYRARDLKLGREVAIKILPHAFIADPDRLARFEREARVLASLNHPNIATIHGVEEQDGVRAIVMELVEGETLANRIARAPLRMPEVIAIARQLAEALHAAHEKGIIHRDLKPANVQLMPAGGVKVLDFGLAKLEPLPAVPQSQAPTVTVSVTGEGRILGTAAYMSPEQARGQAVDRRTDVWALGCILYEMLSGRGAFARGTITDTLAAIVDSEPDWSRLPADTPAGLRRLLRRSLQKSPKLRLHDAADFRIEIDDPDSESAPRSRVGLGAGWIAAIALAIALAGVAVALWSRSSSIAPPSFTRVVRLTSGSAREYVPAISPDGKWVAYLSNARGPTDVWVKFIAGGQPANLTASAGLEITRGAGQGGIEISPDGTRVAVIARPIGDPGNFGTWEIPAPLPGAPHKLSDSGLGVRWSPDGRQIVAMNAGGLAGDGLETADADGSNRRELVKAKDGWHLHWPAWSADGYIYFIRTVSTVMNNAEPSEIYRVRASGGEIEPVVETTRRAVHPFPTADGSLIYAANPEAASLNLWWRPKGGGAARRLTAGLGEYAEPRLSANGRTLVCTLYDVRESLVRIPLAPGTGAAKIPLTDGFGGDLDPHLSPQGRLVFSSTRAGSRHLWTARADGSEARPLTSGRFLDERPSFSPDGDQIAFVSDRSGRRAIWVVNASGGNLRKVAEPPLLDTVLTWSPDMQLLFFMAGAGDYPGLWTVSVADGRVARYPTPGAAAEPAWSAKRNMLAYLEPSTSGRQVTRLAFLDAAGQPQYTALPRPPGASGFSNGMPSWSPDGRRVAVLSQQANAPSSVWIVDPDSPDPYRQLIELPPGVRVRGITWTADGSAILAGLHEMSSHIVLMDQGE
jgi:serine/threonine protein kinase/Tol biopolymer transport system component